MSNVGFKLTIQHTTTVVSDFAASKRFYTEILGLVDLAVDWLPEKQMFLAAGDQLEMHVGEVPGVEIAPSRFNHIALAVDDFDGFLAHLKEAGVVYTNLGGSERFYVQTRPDGVRQTYVQDPDGYWIEITDFA